MALRLVMAKGIVAVHVGTHAGVPSGWTRHTALDSRFPKSIPNNSTDPGGTGGSSAPHDHPYPQHSSHTYSAHNHAGSWGTVPNYTHVPNTATGLTPAASTTANPHGHDSASINAAAITVTNNTAVNTTTQAADPSHLTVIFIMSDGTPMGVPVNGVVWYNGAAPTGFSAHGNLDNRFMKGAATGADAGTQAGTPTHTHVDAGHTHPLTAGHAHVVSTGGPDNVIDERTAGGDTATPTHTHAIGTSGGPSAEPTVSSATETSGNGDFDPAWQKMRAVQKTTDVGVAVGMICIWTGTLAKIPAGWKLCDGSNGTPNLCQSKYVRGAAADGEVGNTGGALTHTHPAAAGHTHGSTGAHTHAITSATGNGSATHGQDSAAINPIPPQNHVHASATYTSPSVSGVGTSSNQANALTANSSNDPVFTTVAYIQLKVATMLNAFFEI